MAKITLEQLQRLSDEIQEEEMDMLFREMAATLPEGTTTLEESREQRRKHNYVTLFLRSLRIHLCLDLLQQGHQSCADVFRQDWDEIVSCLKVLEYEYQVSAPLLSDAVDIVLLLGPDKRTALMKQLELSTRIKIRKQKPLRSEIINSAAYMADYCLEHERLNEVSQIIRSLIELSEERNSSDCDEHCRIVRHALWYIVDINEQLTVDICSQQNKYFSGILNLDSCWFYWYYAAAASLLGNNEMAIALSKKCYEQFLQVEGDASWIGARAGLMYHYSLIDSNDADVAERYIRDTLRKIDNGYYPDMDETADYVSAYARSVLLKIHVDSQTLRGLYSELIRLLDYCSDHADNVPHPRLTVRYAENLMSAYYMETGDYLQAAVHAQNALSCVPPEGMEMIPSDIILYSNLLHIYTALNDTEQMLRLMDILSSREDEYRDDTYVASRISVLMNSAASKLDIGEDTEDDWQWLMDVHRQICSNQISTSGTMLENTAFAMRVLEVIERIFAMPPTAKKDLTKILEIIRFFVERPTIYRFTDTQKMVCYLFLAQTQWHLGTTEVLDTLEKCLHYNRKVTNSYEVRISTLRFAAVVYYSLGRKNLYLPILSEAFSGITDAWQKTTAYMNDHKICQLLSFVQLHFRVCYTIWKNVVSSENAYECLLRFKDLPALIGRERNRILQAAPVNKQLASEIACLQNSLAEAELNDAQNGTDTTQRIHLQLQQLEADFAAEFPKNLCFTDISFHRVCQKLPEGAAIVEYYFGLNNATLSIHSEEAGLELDVFVLRKQYGRATLHHLKIPQGDLIVEQAVSFVDILQDGDDIAADAKKEHLRSALYQALLAPVVPLLNGITTLYLAPDDQLCNLPFEVLYADRRPPLNEQFRIIRLTCGRDLLYFDDIPSAGGSFVLGDPDYDFERGEHSSTRIRIGSSDLNPVEPLPFSGIEAMRIGQHCGCRVCTGSDATKYSLQEALPCRIIHIATHGVFDTEQESDSLYSSYLVFAGYNFWARHKTGNPSCGNGILTADEISRMDLSKTELVVLSACQSGLEDSSYSSNRGLLSAFSAAGVRWIVSHMWEADDFSTPILMDAFYTAYLDMKRSVPEALRYAKQYLRNVSVAELRMNGWFNLPSDPRITLEMRRAIRELSHWPADSKPFENEYYWGGFTVYKSR